MRCLHKTLYNIVHNINNVFIFITNRFKIVSDAIDKIPDDAELGEKLLTYAYLFSKKQLN